MKLVIGFVSIVAQCFAIGLVIGVIVQSPDAINFSFLALPVVFGLYYAWNAITNGRHTWGQDIDGGQQ